MKKFLSLLMMALLCVTTAWAEVVYTLDGTITGGTSGYDSESTIDQDFMTWKVTGNTNMSPWRIGGKSLDRVDKPVYSTTSMGSAITKVSLEVGEASSITVNSLKLIVASDAQFNTIIDEVTASFAAESTIDFTPTPGKEWAQNAYYKFVFNVTVSSTSNKFVEFKKATFCHESVATPVITFDPATAYEGDEVTCTITCATTDANIQYKLNDGEWQDYAPFTLTENTTVYAKATLGDDVSAVAEKTVTFTPITTVADIAALTALQNGTEFRMAQNWTATVVYVSGNFVYIKDNSGSTLLYDVTKNNPELAAGYTISNLYGKVSIYNGLFEVGKPATYSAEATSVVVNPDVMAVNNITADNVNQYVKLEGVTLSAISSSYFTINGTLTGRNRFSVDYPNSPTEGTYDVTGFVGYDSGKSDNMLQFWPTEINKVVSTEFGINVTPTPAEGQEFTAPVHVTIELLNAGEDADFDYYLDGVKQNAYPEGGFTLYKTTTLRVEAMNDDEDMTEAEWTGTYTINLPDLTMKVTPEPGTYATAQTVTASVEGITYGDIKWLWEFTPEGQTEANKDGEVATASIDESGSIYFYGTETLTGRTVEGTFNYVIDPNYVVPVATNKYQLVNSTDGLEAGANYIIVTAVEANYYAMGTITNQKGSKATGFVMNENKDIATLNNQTDVMVLTLGEGNNGWTLKTPEGKYINITGDNANITAVNDVKQVEITFANGRAKISGIEGRQILYRSRNYDVFGNYSSGNIGEEYLTVALYKQVIETPKTETPEISVTEGETEYTIAAAGAGTVKLYKAGEEVDNPCVVTRTGEDQTIVFTATAKEDGKLISDEATQTVTVPALPKTATPTIAVTEGDEAYTVTATGAGTVKLYKDGEEVANPFSVTRTDAEQTFVFTATAQEEGKLISDEASQTVTVPALPAPTYNITLDNQPGEYSKLINVKATVEPALPEGATLKYSIDDADPVEYNASKGVYLFKSSNLTLTAYDADGTTVLATAGGEYKYIVNVFGDLNGDGIVDTSDLGIIVNLILGKY